MNETETPRSVALFSEMPAAFRLARKDLAAAPRAEFKAISGGEIKLEDAGNRVTLCGAYFGNVDEGQDVLEKGSVDKSLSERLPKRLIKLFDRHETGLGEIDRAWIDGPRLWVSGIIPDNAQGSEFRSLVKSGLLGHASIGYVPIQAKRDTIDGVPVRRLVEIKLFEVSGVIWPMNELAEGVMLKSRSGGIEHKHDKWTAELWDLSDVIQALARIRWILRYMELSPEDAALAEMIVAQMSGAQTELATLLHIEPTPESKGDTLAEPLNSGDRSSFLIALAAKAEAAALTLQRDRFNF